MRYQIVKTNSPLPVNTNAAYEAGWRPDSAIAFAAWYRARCYSCLENSFNPLDEEVVLGIKLGKLGEIYKHPHARRVGPWDVDEPRVVERHWYIPSPLVPGVGILVWEVKEGGDVPRRGYYVTAEVFTYHPRRVGVRTDRGVVPITNGDLHMSCLAHFPLLSESGEGE